MHLMFRAAAAATLGLMTIALCGDAAADPQDPGRAPPTLPVARAKNPTTLGAYNGQGGEFKSYNRTSQFIDWTAKPPHHWPFQVRTTLPGATSIVWQFSTMAYPAGSSPLAPPGLIASGRHSLKDGYALFSVDYGQFLPGPESKNALAYRRHIRAHFPAHTAAGKPIHRRPVHRADLTRFREEMAQVFKAHHGQHLEHQREIAILHTVGRGPDQLESLMLIPHLHRPGQTVHSGVRMLPASAYRRLSFPLAANYYVRAVILDAKGAVLGEPSNTVKIEYGDWNSSEAHAKAAALNQQIVANIAKELAIHPPAEKACVPHVRIVAYRPVRFAEHPLDTFIATGDVTINHQTFHKGETIHLADASTDHSSWLEKVGYGFEDAFQFMATFVDDISRDYEQLQEDVVDTLSNASGGVIPKDVLMKALKGGLQELGLPSSMPNFDELVDQGKDELTAAIGILLEDPEAAAAAAPIVNELAAKAKELAKRPPAPGGLNMRPARKALYRPAMVELELSFPRDYHGTATDTVRSFTFVSEANHLFKPAHVVLPPVQRGHKKRLHVFLHEDYESFTVNKIVHVDLYSGVNDAWAAAYAGNAKLHLSNGRTVTIPANQSWHAK